MSTPEEDMSVIGALAMTRKMLYRISAYSVSTDIPYLARAEVFNRLSVISLEMHELEQLLDLPRSDGLEELANGGS